VGEAAYVRKKVGEASDEYIVISMKDRKRYFVQEYQSYKWIGSS
jgi:hypothetical protein